MVHSYPNINNPKFGEYYDKRQIKASLEFVKFENSWTFSLQNLMKLHYFVNYFCILLGILYWLFFEDSGKAHTNNQYESWFFTTNFLFTGCASHFENFTASHPHALMMMPRPCPSGSKQPLCSALIWYPKKGVASSGGRDDDLP